MNENKRIKPVDFMLVYELLQDARDLSVEDVIMLLSMNETLMTYPVQKLGYYLGVLTEPDIPEKES